MIPAFQSISSKSLPQVAPEEVQAVFAEAEEELTSWEEGASERRCLLARIRDQWEGGSRATSEIYHPGPEGLSKEQMEAFRKILKRSHVNLVEPAVDRLTNSIHAGTISRKSSNAVLAELLKTPAHSEAMAQLCENAYAFGTGYLVPTIRPETEELEIAYWLPDPISTILVTAPGDVTSAIGILEVTRAKQGRKAVVRFLTRNFEGLLVLDGGKQSFEVNEHGLNFLPAIIAYGRSMTHRGCKYGRSLVPTLPDSSVRVTNNQVNLELLRDRQTQALLVVQGDPKRTSADEPLAANKFIQFPRDGGDARYESPDSKLDEVIKVTERFLSDAAVQANLPLDTFRPELVQGSDASATAARIRAFPLFQRMVRLGNHWSMVELHAGAVVGGLLLQHGGEYREQTIAQLRKDLGLGVKLRPSMPEAESETLSNWQQRTVNFFTEVEEAIDFYSGHLPEEKKADLATAWRTKNDPTTKSGGEVFQYHVEGGVLVINEVRDRLGLPQVAWGNVTVPELKERGRVMPNESKEADEPEGEVE